MISISISSKNRFVNQGALELRGDFGEEEGKGKKMWCKQLYI